MKHFTFFLLMIFSFSSFAKKPPVKVIPKVIYGLDERMDMYESSDRFINELALSTAAQIYNDNLITVDSPEGPLFKLVAPSWEQKRNLCVSERYSKQPAGAQCSGFLIAPDKLITAGHCIYRDSNCSQHYWVFDYANTTEEKKTFTFKSEQMVRCLRIIERVKDDEALIDYAVLKLERPVLGRAPLKYRKAGKVSDDAVLTVIGYPNGLPLKIAAAADMRDNSHPNTFLTNADTFKGNSGSAVVDARTGVVEGVLVRGDSDYASSVNASGKACMIPVIRDYHGGSGEGVTRITIVKSIQK